MSAVSLYRKIGKRIVCALAVLFTSVAVAFAAFASQIKTVELGESFYFLVTDDTRVEAGVVSARMDGGAGYLLRHNGKDYVALSVYLEESDGVAVQTSLSEAGETTELLQKGAEKLYFKTKKEKANANLYVGALDCLRGCMDVLEECVSRLEKDITQNACKRLLSTIKKQFAFLSGSYKSDYAAFARVCAETTERLSELTEDTVYAKDLRYLLCQLAEKYVSLTSEFSL